MNAVAIDVLNKEQITKDICINALSYLMLLKRKRAGDVKARGCADGRPQCEYISKEESSLPTVSTYALFISCHTDAMEGQKVVTYNITGAFLQADWPKDNDCYLKFEGLMVKMICKIDLSYEKYVLTNKTTGKKRLCGNLTKAVYRMLLGAILFYQKLSSQLYEWGYKQNPYDLCTFNKTVDGQQMTIQFHVDNLKLSHMDQGALDNLVKELNDVFRTSRKELAETKGDVHEYLGRTIDFSKRGHVIFTIHDYIEDIIGTAPLDMNGTAPDPARAGLFTVDKMSPRLNIQPKPSSFIA